VGGGPCGAPGGGTIPKGLPYVWVHFGMDSGFAHVIEDEDRFPANFAQVRGRR